MRQLCLYQRSDWLCGLTGKQPYRSGLGRMQAQDKPLTRDVKPEQCQIPNSHRLRSLLPDHIQNSPALFPGSGHTRPRFVLVANGLRTEHSITHSAGAFLAFNCRESAVSDGFAIQLFCFNPGFCALILHSLCHFQVRERETREITQRTKIKHKKKRKNEGNVS